MNERIEVGTRNMNQTRHDSHLFTLRLWPQSRANEPMTWRGEVTHVLSGETRHFREWPALVAFLAEAPVFQPHTSINPTPLSGDDTMNEDHAQRHCLMVSQESGEGTAGSAIIWYLDWLDDQGVPHSEQLDSHYQGFKQLGTAGWRLVQVIERPAAAGVYDGPVGASTHYYFSRPARGRG